MLTGRRCGGTPDDVAPVQQDAPAARLLEAGQHAQKRGLAAAGGTEQREQLALAMSSVTPSTADTSPKRLDTASKRTSAAAGSESERED